MQDLYNMIFKRKSFHIFRNVGNDSVNQEELNDIEKTWGTLIPLREDIKTCIRIVPEGVTTCKRGGEYCILLYSEEKNGYLQNIGYLGEQLDLYLVSRNIGTLWFGIGKPDIDIYNGLKFVIMFSIRKVEDQTKYRKDMFKSKRKPLNEIWQGDVIGGVSNIVRFTPSACNTQPWLMKNGDTLEVYRYKKIGKRGIMPADKVVYYNQIDIGILLCFLDLCLTHEGITNNRKLYIDDASEKELTLSAQYNLN